MPVILTELEAFNVWMRADRSEASKLQRPLPGDALQDVTRGHRSDGGDRAGEPLTNSVDISGLLTMAFCRPADPVASVPDETTPHRSVSGDNVRWPPRSLAP